VAAVGAAWGTGLLAAALARLPARSRRVVDAALVAGGVLAAAGAGLVALALVLDAGTAAELAGGPEPGAVGGVGLLLTGVALAPNAVVLAVAWLAGPGFAVGTGTAVSPFATEIGALPALPLVAALPGGPPPGFAVAALAVPVLAGALAGRLLARSAGARLVDALMCGVLAGAATGVLAVVAGGPLGDERLADVGPSAPAVALAVAVEVAGGALVAMAVARRRG
ncbi:MAG TPA: DUF6350 family protein, partial [Mycobacteriales bacterium]|nr:DUF6350 family protein [Mycobacteriales bacterium]